MDEDARICGISGDYNGDGFVDAADYVTVGSRPESTAPKLLMNQDLEVENDEAHAVGGDAAFGEVASNFDRGVLAPYGWSWGVTNSSTHEIVSSGEGDDSSSVDRMQGPSPLGWSWGMNQTGTMDLSSLGGQEGEEAALGAADGRIGPQAGDATPVEGVLLPYIEQDNLYKQSQAAGSGFADGTSNTLMRLANHSPGLVDVWEHASSTDLSGPEANGIIAILIGLQSDPSDPSGNTLSTADHLLGEEPIYYPASSRGMNHEGPDVGSSLLSVDEYFSRYDDGLLDEEAGSAATLAHIYGPGTKSILHEENEFSFPRMIQAAG